MLKLKQATQRPSTYPPRANTGANPYDWLDPEYKPTEYTSPLLLDPKPEWADDEDVPFHKMLARQAIDEEGNVADLAESALFSWSTQRFLNPRGKTGIIGRGLLGKWGANHAADVIVTKYNEDDELSVLLCEKQVGDGQSDLCFPAGMVDPGESVPETLRRELTEEAVDDGQAVTALFNTCGWGRVYAGVVDDYRNTDNAWMVSTVHHYHATPYIASQLKLNVKDKDEIKKSQWYVASKVTNMYASHKDWLDKVMADCEKKSTSLFVSHAVPHGVTAPFSTYGPPPPPSPTKAPPAPAPEAFYHGFAADGYDMAQMDEAVAEPETPVAPPPAASADAINESVAGVKRSRDESESVDVE